MKKSLAAESHNYLDKKFKPLHPFENAKVSVPEYLEKTYWWAYLHPRAVHFFERQWIINAILWGNYGRLRDAVLSEMGDSISGRILQVACAYGDFSTKLIKRLTPHSRLDVIDVAPVQLDNLNKKINPPQPTVFLTHQDSTDLSFEDGSFDTVVLFFLLHEQPADIRAKTLREAIRVTKSGGKIIFMDYHKPTIFSPFRYIMVPILSTLEPFAMDLWRKEIIDWVPKPFTPASLEKKTYFGGLYQKVVISVE
jgi:ubiquinone/menaquinone biosynthesis C-methylase UbiE